MSNLLALQRKMMQWLQTETGDISNHVFGTEKVSVDLRLSVYANAYRYRLIDALSDNYPSVHTLLGDDAFYQKSLIYIRAYPSEHFSIRYFGSHLEAFLAQQRPDNSLLAEMAQFEWCLRAAFDANDTPTLDLDAAQTIEPEAWADLRFRLHPSVARLDLEWNVPQLWSVIDNQGKQIPFEISEYPIAWLVWRKQLKTYYRSLAVDEAWALDHVMKGNSFAALCEGVCEWVDEEHAPARVAGFIHTWLAADLVTELIT